MTDVFPKLCMDCKHSKPETRSQWKNRCFHPAVVCSDSWALADNDEGQPYGVSCRDERQKRSWFAPEHIIQEARNEPSST